MSLAAGRCEALSRLPGQVGYPGVDDFNKRQDWQDFWRIHYKR